MKKSVSLVLLLLNLVILTSCGGPKTATKLEVSTSAIAMANNSFPGGLIIMGKSSKERFVLPIASGTGSGSSVTIELPHDTWQFWAIGWEGAGKFTGNSKCGVLRDVVLKDSEQTVNLKVDYAQCSSATDFFGSAGYRNGNSFDQLDLVTCGWLYEDNAEALITSSTSSAFCNSASSLDPKYKHWAKSARIEVQQEVGGVFISGLSQCFATGTDGLFTTAMTFPQLGLPVKVTLFSESNCPSNPEFEISSFDFSNGLGASYTEFDAVFNELSAQEKLFLPSYDTRRGYSSLLAEKPAILCNGNPCLGVPSSTPAGKNRIISSGEQFVFIPVPASDQTCANISAVTPNNISPAPSLAEIKSNCEMRDGRLLMRINYTTLGTPASLQIIFQTTSATVTLENSTYWDAHNIAWNLLGYPLTTPPIDSIKLSFSAFFDRQEDMGLLSEVRELMGPEGAGGFLGAGLTCVTATATKYMSLYDEGQTRSYRVQLLNGSTQTVGTYLADGTVLSGDTFQKRILIAAKNSDGSYTNQQVMHFNCGYKVGRFEFRRVDSSRIERQVIEWNTEVASVARVRKILFEENRENGVPTNINTSYSFVETPGGDPMMAHGRIWSLNIVKNGANYEYYSRASQVFMKDGISGFVHTDAAPATADTDIVTTATDFVTDLAAVVSTPANNCVDKTAFLSSSCGGLTSSFAASIYDPGFSPASLAPAAISGYFTSF